MDLKGLVGPLIQEAFDQVLYPMLQTEVGKISDPMIKKAVMDVLAAVKPLADAEIAKL